MSQTQVYYTSPIAQGPKFRILDSDTPLHPNPKLQFKVVIVGDSGCGKTSLFTSYIRGSFPTQYEPTIFENHRAFLQRGNSTTEILTIDLWDTAGQEDYERLRRLSYQDANLVILAYATDAKESLLNIPEVWAPEIMGFCQNTPIVLCGLKADKPPQVNPSEAFNVARSIGAVAHIACASIEMRNINELFDAVFNTVFNNFQTQNSNVAPERSSKRFSHLRSQSKQKNDVDYQSNNNQSFDNNSKSNNVNSSNKIDYSNPGKNSDDNKSGNCCVIM